MTKAIIDTNVLLVANEQHSDVSPECVEECVRRLQDMQESGVTVIDDEFRILSEYQNKTNPSLSKGVGDVFLKWLLRNSSNGTRVHQVCITEIATNEFSEFPDLVLQAQFDAPDRKFAAVANAHPEKPIIWQAADCKWLDWWPTLKEKGVVVDFLCPKDVCRFYKNKFPKKSSPQFPKIKS